MADNKLLESFGQFTPEGVLTPGFNDHFLFFVGRDDVHSILLSLITAEKLELDFNMFGFDDDTLNEAIISKLKDSSVVVKGTLDKSQAGGVHEKKLLSLDEASDPTFLNSIAIGQSATHQISHTKGGVLVGQGVWFEGSTNWSNSGEGTGISLKADVSNPKGWSAQNNTLLVSVNPVGLSRFKTQLAAEHLIAVKQGGLK